MVPAAARLRVARRNCHQSRLIAVVDSARDIGAAGCRSACPLGNCRRTDAVPRNQPLSGGVLRGYHQLMAFPDLGAVLWLILFGCVAYVCYRVWRSRAISCAKLWAAQQDLSVVDWPGAVFSMMDRQRPTLSFNANDASGRSVDVKLRLRVPMLQLAWEVAEVAYCLPTGACEDDTASPTA